MKKTLKHIVLFPDGNRRWAEKRGLPSIEGHKQGHTNLIKLCKWCNQKRVKVLTTFGFSTENWNRPKQEVKYFMQLLEKGLSLGRKEINKLEKEGVKVTVIGQKERLPKSLQKAIINIEEKTKNNKGLQLNLAVSYGGRWDIMQAIKEIVKRKIPLSKINEDMVGEYLSTNGLPAPDLIIRAGGEKRLSNFLLWQAAYSELYFSKKLWPDFSKKDFEQAFGEYNRRQRRFGH